MWWPVAATDDVFAIARYGNVTGIISNLYFSYTHFVRSGPEVNLGQLAVTTHGIPETAWVFGMQLVVMLGSFQYVYCIAGVDMGNHFVFITIDYGYFSYVTLDNQNKVFPITAMHGLCWVVFRLYIHLVALFH